MANESPHARDLGYLERFIQKLEDQARGLADGPRQQALRLLGDQRSQWTTIMDLLSGADSGSGPETPASPPSPPETAATPPPTVRRSPAQGGLTVGSLIGHP